MNFYQSDLRRYINKEIYKKPSFTLEFLWKKYFGTIKEQKKLGKSFRWFMVHGMERGDLLYFNEEIKKELARVRRDFWKSWGDMFFQFGIVDSLSKNKTKRLKEEKVLEELRKRRVYQQSNMLERYNLRPSEREHMPTATLILDLTLGALDMKADFSKSCKRFLNKAKRADLSFYRAEKRERKKFRQVRYTMAYDKGFSILSEEMFLHLMEYLIETKQGDLFLIKQGSKIVSGSIVLFFEEELIYLYGATDRSFGAIGAHYRLQYEIMKRWHQHKYKTMDLLGVAPPGFELGHHLEWVTRFKQSFGWTTISYGGNYDLIFNTLWYKAFQLRHSNIGGMVRKWKKKMKEVKKKGTKKKDS